MYDGRLAKCGLPIGVGMVMGHVENRMGVERRTTCYRKQASVSYDPYWLKWTGGRAVGGKSNLDLQHLRYYPHSDKQP